MVRNGQRGFNLIEVMIAVVVLSLGLLGVAGLQLSSVRNTQGSFQRSLAAVYMNDMAERIYANTPGVLTYGTFDSNGNNCAAPAQICARESTTGAVPATCTAAQMATYDLFAVTCGMPNGAGRSGGVLNTLTNGRLRTACTNPLGGACNATSPITITVSWADRGSSGSTNADAQSTTNAQTISLVIQP